jgi:hypothetical protein
MEKESHVLAFGKKKKNLLNYNLFFILFFIFYFYFYI